MCNRSNQPSPHRHTQGNLLHDNIEPHRHVCKPHKTTVSNITTLHPGLWRSPEKPPRWCVAWTLHTVGMVEVRNQTGCWLVLGTLCIQQEQHKKKKVNKVPQFSSCSGSQVNKQLDEKVCGTVRPATHRSLPR